MPSRPNFDDRVMPLACILAELVWLTEMHGAATARLWHERIRPDLSAISAERHWERVKAVVVNHGVPHERIDLPAVTPSGDRNRQGNGRGPSPVRPVVGIRMRICVLEVDEWVERVRIARTTRNQERRAREGVPPAARTLEGLATRRRRLERQIQADILSFARAS